MKDGKKMNFRSSIFHLSIDRFCNTVGSIFLNIMIYCSFFVISGQICAECVEQRQWKTLRAVNVVLQPCNEKIIESV